MAGPLIAALPAISGAISAVSGIFGLFKKKKKPPPAPTPQSNIVSQALGVREAAAAQGFNPLTMLQYGQSGGAMGGGGGYYDTSGGAPLASIDLITGGLKDISDVFSGDAARRRQADQLNLDLTRLKMEEARAGIVLLRQNAADRIGSGYSTLGRSAAVQTTAAGERPAKAFGMGENPLAPGRKKDVASLTNSPGVFEVENRATGGRPITIPGDGEPWGVDELATAVIVGAPQVFDNAVGGGKPMSERFKDKWTPDDNSVVGKIKKWWKK